MANQKDKNQASIAIDGDPTFEEDCKTLLEVLSEEHHSKLTEESDPFDNYVQRMLAKPHQDANQLISRFVKGYQALINELKSSQ